MRFTFLLILFVIPWSIKNLNSQVIFVSTLDNEIYSLNINSCELTFVTSISKQIFDITFHPNGKLYGISADGDLFEIDITPPITFPGYSLIFTFDDPIQDFNSLTVSANGVFYATGSFGNLFRYKLGDATAVYLGNFGETATGDLTFYNGQLYVAITGDRIMRINLNNLANSTVVVHENIPGSILGIVSYAEDCADINTYAISDGDSDVYLIDYTSSSFNLICELPIEVGGGASTYEFNASSPIVVNTPSKINPTCGLSNGQISISAFGGTGMLNYSIDGISFQSTGQFTGLPSGNYTIFIKDENDCTVPVQVNLQDPGTPAISIIQKTDASCDKKNGRIQLAGTGGAGMLSYSINGINYQPGNSFNDLSPGPYVFYVKDQYGCTDSTSINILMQPSPRWDSISLTPTSCGNSNGTILLSVISGLPPFTYSLNGGSGQLSNTFAGLSSGSYVVKVSDANNCELSDTVSIDKSSAPVIHDLQLTSETCNSHNASIAIVATSDTSSLQYSINGSFFQLQPLFSNLDSGLYTVIALDSVGCYEQENVFVNAVAPGLIQNLEIVHTSCGLKNGSIKVLTSGGPQITYSLNGSGYQNDYLFNNLDAGIYEIAILDQNHCRDTFTTQIAESEHPLIDSLDVDGATCELKNGQLVIHATSSTPTIQYSINDRAFQTDSNFIGLASGFYTVSVIDANGCTAENTITIKDTPALGIYALRIKEADCGMRNGSIYVDPSGGTGMINYILDATAPQLANIFFDLFPDDYALRLQDEIGCIADTLIRLPQGKCPFYVPNIFTPNNDGINDYLEVHFHPDFLGFVESFCIFDRWGNNVFSALQFSPEQGSPIWDGSYNGRLLDSGVFTYQLILTHDNQEIEMRRGNVTLLR